MNKSLLRTLSRMFLAAGLWGVAGAQTQVDLKNQSKSADLSNVGATKPMQTGTTLPATCSVGQMFFETTAPAGNNLFACSATNVWTEIVGNGVTSVTAGTGIVTAQTGAVATVAVDETVIPSEAMVQDTTSNIVTITSSSTSALTGTMNPTLGAYSDKQLVEFTWNLNCAGGAMTLAVDGNSAVNLVKADGATTLGTTDCQGGQTNLFTYDGTLGVFKQLGGGSPTKTVPNKIWLPGAYGHSGNYSDTVLWTVPTASGAFPTSANAVFSGLNFPSGSTTIAYWSTILPASWTGALTLQLYSTLNNSVSGTGTYVLYTAAACITPGSTNIATAPAFNAETAVAVTFTGTQYQSGNYSAQITPAATGCASGQMMIVRVRRGTGSGDTASDAAILYGALLGLPYTI